MIQTVKNCASCPIMEYSEGFGKCLHPDSKLETMAFSLFPSDKVHDDCPLKTIDLILTVRER